MTRIGVVGPFGLMAKELLQVLGVRYSWDQIDIFSAQEDEVGQLLECVGGAALIQPFDEHGFSHHSVVFFVEDRSLFDLSRQSIKAPTTIILMAPTTTIQSSATVIPGVNDDDAFSGLPLVSPPPEAIHLAHILAPLIDLGLESATAVFFRSASMRGQEALDLLLKQTQSILAFQGGGEGGLTREGMAFNAFVGPDTKTSVIPLIHEVLNHEPSLEIETVDSGLFHGLGLSLHLTLAPGHPVEEISRVLQQSANLVIQNTGNPPSITDIANREEILVSNPRPGAEEGTFWLWSVMDNLTRGGALNAVEIVEILERVV